MGLSRHLYLLAEVIPMPGHSPGLGLYWGVLLISVKLIEVDANGHGHKEPVL